MKYLKSTPDGKQKENTNKPNDGVLSVSELNRKVKTLLETNITLIWIEGEISNLSQPASGHWYFALKDERAQVRSAMFKGRNQFVRFKPKNGDLVRVRARVSLYEGRGDYQIIAEHIEDAGYGLLQRRYEELKEKLEEEGLFDQGFKKPIPTCPKRIGIISSSTGAALRDVLHVLKRRSPNTSVTIFPSSVQGEKAPDELIKALQIAEAQTKMKRCDVIILCRGGGSIEDLWAFNSEQLARVIFSAEIPIVSGVGHEIDFTITDFVSDLRAPTPSAAAELVSPDVQAQLKQLNDIRYRLENTFWQHFKTKIHQLELLASKLRHPGYAIEQWYQSLDQLYLRLSQAIKVLLTRDNQTFTSIEKRLLLNSPKNTIAQQRTKISTLSTNLRKLINSHIELKKGKAANAASMLDMVSPLSTIKRGYSIVRDESGKIIKKTSDVREKQTLTITMTDGDLLATAQTNKKLNKIRG